jgi:folate-binding protein YgfZ
MSSKPDAAVTLRATAVLAGGVIEVSGRDAGAFLQAQLMSDVRLLSDGQWQWSGWLTPKGRVVALAALLRFDAERYWMALPDHPAADLAPALQRYVLRSKTSLRIREDLGFAGSLRTPASLGSAATGNRFDTAGDTIQMDWSGERPRTLTIAPINATPTADAETCDAGAWAVEDLAHGLPRLGVGSSYTPQMLGLERLQAYSVKKGCYPGQEIVARTHFLGQAKRGLRRLHSTRALAPGTTLSGAAGTLGEVVCAASSGTRHEALAILATDSASVELHADGAPDSTIRVIGFAEGLAR